MKRGLLLGLLLLLGTMVGGLGWLLASESGMQWAYRHAAVQLPGLLTIDRLQGRLAGDILLHGFDYRQQDLRIAGDRLELRWNPRALLAGEIRIEAVDIAALTIELPLAADTEGEAASAFEMPALATPFMPVTLDRLDIHGLRLDRGGEVQLIEMLHLGGVRLDREIAIDAAQLVAADYQASIAGSLTPTNDWPHRFDIGWRLRLKSGAEFNGSGRLEGDLQATSLTQAVQGAARLDLRLDLMHILRQPTWKLDARLAQLDAATLVPDLGALTGGASVNASGDLDSLRANGEFQFDTPQSGPVSAAFSLARLATDSGGAGLLFEQLALKTDHGNIEASGRLGWSTGLDWSARILGRELDPARVAAEWPGKLGADLQVDGRLVDGVLGLEVLVNAIDGRLRGFPVTLRGRVNWSDDSLAIAGLDFTSAGSSLKVNGRVGEALALDWSLASSNLGELWPGAGGSLTASGALGGTRQTPGLTASVAGQSIAFADLSVARLRGEIGADLVLAAPYLAADGRFQISARAEALRIAGQGIARLDIDADRRGISASADTDVGQFDVRLEGELDGDAWRGRLLEAGALTPDYGNWKLRAPGSLEITQQGVSLGEACLDQDKGASLCATIDGENDDWRLQARAAGVDLDWLDRWIPAELNASAKLAATAALQFRAPDRLHGDIQVDLSPGSLDIPTGDDQTQSLEFAGGKLIASLADSGIRASAEFELRNDESCKATVEMPVASLLALDLDRQQLQGEARCLLADLDVAEALLRDVDDLHGAAEFDLRLRGTTAQPRLDGTARLTGASFYIPRLQLRVDRLDAEASSSGLDSLEFSGDADIAGGRIEVKGRTRLDGAAGWPTRIDLSGRELRLAPLLLRGLPADLDIEGALTLDGGFDLRLPDRLDGSLRLQAAGGAIAYRLSDGEEIRWPVSVAELLATADADGIRADASLVIADNRLDAQLRLPRARLLALDPDTQAIAGLVDIEVPDMSLISAFATDIQRPQGKLKASLAIDGTLTTPRIRVNGELAEASLNIPRLGLVVGPIVASIATDDEGSIRLDARVEADQGKLQVKGLASFDPLAPWRAVVEITGQNFPVARTAEARVDLSPDLVITIGDYMIDLRGEVLVPTARLRPRDLTTAARVSSDVVLVGTEETVRNWRVTSKVRVVLGERIDFYGYGFEGKLGGNLTIDEQPGQPTRGSGEITIISGRYQAYGQNLNIESGRLLFTGGPMQNPGLDVVAVRQTGDVTAGLRVGGRLQQPELELFSTPAMGQTDALSYLLTGGPLDTATSQQGAMMANAALAIGLSGGDRIARSLGDRFGLDDFRVESSSDGEQASLVVGRYLSPRLYVSYGVGLIESINTINLRYRLSPRWRVEAESGAEQGADLLFSIDR